MDVSVICPVFDTPPALLRAAVQSVLAQDGPHGLELILVDDRSTDPDTLAALRALASEGRVRVFTRGRNGGPAQARAFGIAQATHDWIAFVDSDDLWPPGKLALADQVAAERPDTRWIGGRHSTLVPDGSVQPNPSLGAAVGAQTVGIAGRLEGPALTRALVGHWTPLGANLLRKDLIAAVGGFDPQLIYGEDWLLVLRLSTRAPLDWLEHETYVLRRQGASMMHSPGRMTSKFARSAQVAQRDPALAGIRRELRWFSYAMYKDLAMNNAANRRRMRAAYFGLRALAVDPREVAQFGLLLRTLTRSGPALEAGLRRYSPAEQVRLTDGPTRAGSGRGEPG